MESIMKALSLSTYKADPAKLGTKSYSWVRCTRIDDKPVQYHAQIIWISKLTSHKMFLTNHIGYATIKVAQSNSVVIGNHNLCRNVGGKMPVPWCYIDDEGNSGFCFKHPGCDQCTGQVEDKDRYCSELYPWECDYTIPKTMARPNDRWNHCKKTCCSHMNC